MENRIEEVTKELYEQMPGRPYDLPIHLHWATEQWQFCRVIASQLARLESEIDRLERSLTG